MTKIREEKMPCKLLEALCEMAEPPTLESITNYVEKQIRAASLIGIIFGQAVSITITPEIKDGFVTGFSAKMDAEDKLEAIGQMSLEEALTAMAPQLAENIRRENEMPDISQFLNGILGAIGKEMEEGNDNDDAEQKEAPADAPAEDKPQEQAAS